MNWDDLRVLLAVADSGSILKASITLGCSHSTVVRRLDALESDLDASLVRRHRRGCDLTPAGEDAIAELRVVEEAMRAVERRVAGHRQKLVGRLKISFVDAGAQVFMPILASIHEAHPELGFDLLQAEHHVDLDKGEADLAVRLALSPDADLVGRCHGTMASAPYAHRELLQRLDPWSDAPWVVMHESMGPIPQRSWEQRHLDPARSWMKVNSASLMLQAVSDGVGCGVLPCILADPIPDLVRLRPPDPTLDLHLWTLYHRDLRHAARLRAVVERLSAAMVVLRPLLEGHVEAADAANALLQSLT
ncbi:MAG: DNA-binding transcriptional LysR family regulator [Myxococcota bacterium]|jgi:DNA-binding transcriptional LysR family regulator